MKDIDIIKAAQHVKDDLISEAIDFAPIPRRSFKWGYFTAAACAAIALVAVPVIVKRYGSLDPGSVNSSNSGAEVSINTSSSSSDICASGTNGITGSGAPLIKPVVSVYKDCPRTFYNYLGNSGINFDEVTSKGKVYLDSRLTDCMARPHDTNDEFAVRVIECSGAGNEAIASWLSQTCGIEAKDSYLENETVYLTEAQIKNIKPSSELAAALTLAVGSNHYHNRIVDEDFLKTYMFGKLYAQIRLDYRCLESVMITDGETVIVGDSKADPEKLKDVENYIKKFAEDHGVNTALLYAGETNSYLGTLSGEFDTETLWEMLGDERVVSITQSSEGGYVFEQRGLFANTVMVTRNQMKMIKPGISYTEIFRQLGNSAAYGNPKYRQYITEDGGLIMFNFESLNDWCPLSGEELYDSAIPLTYTGTLPNTVDEKMIYGVVARDGLFIWLDNNGYEHVGYISGDYELIHRNGTAATDEELFRSGKRAFISCNEQLYTNPPQYVCTKVVILDDPINSNSSTESGAVILSDKTVTESDVEAVIKNYNDNGKSVLDPSITGAEVYDTELVDLDFDGRDELLVLVGQANYKAFEVWKKSGEMRLVNSFGAGKVNFIDKISLKKAEIDGEKLYLFSFAYDEGNNMKADEVLSAIRKTADGYEVEYLLSRGTISYPDISDPVIMAFYRKGWSKYDIGLGKDHGDISKEEYNALYEQYTSGLSDTDLPYINYKF